MGDRGGVAWGVGRGRGVRAALLAVLLGVLLQPLVAVASSDIGFRVRQGELSVTVRFPFDQLAGADTATRAEFGDSGGLLFDLLAWLHAQRDSLAGVEGELVFRADLERHELAVELDGQSLVAGLGWEPGQAREVILGVMANVARTGAPAPNSAGEMAAVPLAVVVYRDPSVAPLGGADAQFGALPGLSYSQPLGAYVDLFWQAPQGEQWQAALDAGEVQLYQQAFGREELGALLGSIE